VLQKRRRFADLELLARVALRSKIEKLSRVVLVDLLSVDCGI